VLHILICEDDPGQRSHIESVVRKSIDEDSCDKKLVVSTDDPTRILDYLKTHPCKRSLYFLDIDLQHDELDGLKLAAIIRESDPYAKIAFITTHSELAYLTYEYKLKAMDFFIKERLSEIEKWIEECINTAYARYLEEKTAFTKHFRVDANGEIWNIPHDDILFFETNSRVRHRVILHTENSKIDFRGFISEVEQRVPTFFRCHKSFLVNLDKISYIDKVSKEAIMVSDRRVSIAEKKVNKLLNILEKN